MDFVYQIIDTKAESGARAGQIRYADDSDARSKLQSFQFFLLGVLFAYATEVFVLYSAPRHIAVRKCRVGQCLIKYLSHNDSAFSS